MAGLFCKQKADISYEMTRQAVNRSNPSASSKHPGQNLPILSKNWQNLECLLKCYFLTFKSKKIGFVLLYGSTFQLFILKEGLLILGQNFKILTLVLLALVKVHIPKVPTPLQSQAVGFLYIFTKLYPLNLSKTIQDKVTALVSIISNFMNL